MLQYSQTAYVCEPYLSVQTITPGNCIKARFSPIWKLRHRTHLWLTLLWPQLPVFVYRLNQDIPPGVGFIRFRFLLRTNSKYFFCLSHLDSGFSFSFPRKPVLHVAAYHPILLPSTTWMNYRETSEDLQVSNEHSPVTNPSDSRLLTNLFHKITQEALNVYNIHV